MNKLIIALVLISFVFLSGCLEERTEVRYVYITPEPTVKPTPEIKYVYVTPESTVNPTPEKLDYKYNLAVGAAGQIAYQRYAPSYCAIAIGAAGQVAISGDCDSRDYKIIMDKTGFNLE